MQTKPDKPYPHKDTPETFWERMVLIHGKEVLPKKEKKPSQDRLDR